MSEGVQTYFIPYNILLWLIFGLGLAREIYKKVINYKNPPDEMDQLLDLLHWGVFLMCRFYLCHLLFLSLDLYDKKI